MSESGTKSFKELIERLEGPEGDEWVKELHEKEEKRKKYFHSKRCQNLIKRFKKHMEEKDCDLDYDEYGNCYHDSKYIIKGVLHEKLGRVFSCIFEALGDQCYSTDFEWAHETILYEGMTFTMIHGQGTFSELSLVKNSRFLKK